MSGARLIAALAGVAVLTGCSAEDQTSEGPTPEGQEEAQVEAPVEPSAEPPASSPDAPADDGEPAGGEAADQQATVQHTDDVLSSDAEPDLQHDIGTIDEIVIDSEGTTYLRFNRWQRFDGASGPDFTEAPSNAGATDVGFIDENPALRAYPVSARVSVGEISNYQELCEMSVDEPEYVEVDLPTLVDRHPDALVSLSFDEFGEVFVVSDERSC